MIVIDNLEAAERACRACGVPDYMAESAFEYVVNKRAAGGFFMAVVCNDFMRAAQAADHFNANSLLGWAKLLYNYFPPESYGSAEFVEAWLASKEAA